LLTGGGYLTFHHRSSRASSALGTPSGAGAGFAAYPGSLEGWLTTPVRRFWSYL